MPGIFRLQFLLLFLFFFLDFFFLSLIFGCFGCLAADGAYELIVAVWPEDDEEDAEDETKGEQHPY